MKPYNCTRIQEQLELTLLEGAALPTPLQAHLAGCPSCAAEAASLQGIIAALSATPAPVAPAGLTARIVPLVLAAAQTSRRQGVVTRVLRPVAAFATAFGIVIASLAAAGSALVVSAALTAGSRTPESATQAPAATAAPLTPAPPATAAPATATPVTPAPTSPPAPSELPRRTPKPVSPDPSEGESTAPTESTSP